MKKTLVLIGMGPGLSFGVAEKFGKEGFQIGMISRNEKNLESFQQQLSAGNIVSAFAPADVSSTSEMIGAVKKLRSQLGSISVLHYNAVDNRMKNLMDETADDLVKGFRISVANAFAATMEVLPDLEENNGAVLLTGGGSANYPNPDMASISLGKAGIRNLALQLHESLKARNVFVGTLTIGGWINPESKTHSPAILARKFWELYQEREKAEVVY